MSQVMRTFLLGRMGSIHIHVTHGAYICNIHVHILQRPCLMVTHDVPTDTNVGYHELIPERPFTTCNGGARDANGGAGIPERTYIRASGARVRTESLFCSAPRPTFISWTVLITLIIRQRIEIATAIISLRLPQY